MKSTTLQNFLSIYKYNHDDVIKQILHQQVINSAFALKTLKLSEEELLIWKQTTQTKMFVKRIDTGFKLTNIAVPEHQKKKSLFNLTAFKYKPKSKLLKGRYKQHILINRDNLIETEDRLAIMDKLADLWNKNSNTKYTWCKLLKPTKGGFLITTSLSNFYIGYIATKELNFCLRWLEERNENINSYPMRKITKKVIFTKKSTWPCLPAIRVMPYILQLKVHKCTIVSPKTLDNIENNKHYFKFKKKEQKKFLRISFARTLLNLKILIEQKKYKFEKRKVSYLLKKAQKKWFVKQNRFIKTRFKRRFTRLKRTKKNETIFFKLFFYHIDQKIL